MAALLEHRHGTNPTLHTTSSRDTRSLALEPERAEGPMDLWWSTPPLLHPLAAAVPSSNQQHRSQAVKDGVVSADFTGAYPADLFQIIRLRRTHATRHHQHDQYSQSSCRPGDPSLLLPWT
ncbi:hypothetical protein SMMN14_00872 [Sphaerulina musiva]